MFVSSIASHRVSPRLDGFAFVVNSNNKRVAAEDSELSCMRSLSVSLYTSAKFVCISFSFSLRDIVACNESPSISSQSEPKVNCEMFRNGSVPGSRESKPGMDGAVVTLQRAFPSWPPVSIFGISVATVDAARLLNASWPSSSKSDSASWPSKIRAASATAASRSLCPTMAPSDTAPTVFPPTVPPPVTDCTDAAPPDRDDPDVTTRLSVHVLALPCTSARRSAPTKDTSRVGSRPCSGTNTARFGCSRLSRTCVATRLMSPRSKFTTPLGRINAGSATPFISTSPLTPKFKTNGYTALSSGPTINRSRLNRSGNCSEDGGSTPLGDLEEDSDAEEVDRCRNPAKPRLADPPKGFKPRPASVPGADEDAVPGAGAALGCRNAVPLDKRKDPPTSGSKSVPLITMSASSRPLYTARARMSSPEASARIPPCTSARATRPSQVSPLAPLRVCSTGTAPRILSDPRGPHFASNMSAYNVLR
mmetsp:Transcript_7212/g.24146  ORF Transcript_7212/g.24146 Transcript_7212/m.24146 type:complete len:478 (+) Transcript_7212:1285-2718(+)